MSIQLLHKKLIKKKLTISVAESCTGGLLAHNLTKLANSSKYFQMGLTTYSNQAKIKILKINKNIIKIIFPHSFKKTYIISRKNIWTILIAYSQLVFKAFSNH